MSLKIPLHSPWIEKDEVLKLKEVWESGNISTGWQVEQFERELAEYIGTKHVVCFSSGTAALHLALIVAGIEPGDEVIVPAFTFPSTAHIPVLLGAKPIYADTEYVTYNINPKEVEKTITDKTKAIIPVSAFGLPYDMEAIRAIADKHSLKVIGDNAGAIGSKYWGARLGAADCDLHEQDGKPKQDKEGHIIRGKAEDISIFSFHATKTLTTGEGGCACTDNADWAVQMRMLRDHGSIVRSEPEHKKRFVTVGFNYRMSDDHAAVGRVQLAKLEEMIARRRSVASIYTELLETLNPIKMVGTSPERMIKTHEKTYNILTPFEGDGYFHTFQRYVIYLTYADGVIVRNEMRKQGIETTFGYYCVPDEPFNEQIGTYKRCPTARKCFQHTLALPCYHTITKDQQETVVNTLKEILRL